ncbi:MAG TPA: hypothetical protein VF406_00565 [Thermodesulfobacteriota bacterium]
MARQYPQSDPRHHAADIKARLSETVRHVREGVDRVEDPKAQALFETTAEVLNGLVAAYDHYEGRTEKAWR